MNLFRNIKSYCISVLPTNIFGLLFIYDCFKPFLNNTRLKLFTCYYFIYLIGIINYEFIIDSFHKTKYVKDVESIDSFHKNMNKYNETSDTELSDSELSDDDSMDTYRSEESIVAE
jgi:hypothetical protein